jgi:type II secretion system protein J
MTRFPLPGKRTRRGFTLLEVTIAMTFVALLVSGISLTISTSLKVWERATDTADLNQEARAVIEVLSRDIRGAYLGLQRQGGYLLAGAKQQQKALGPTLEFTTESSTIARAAFLPEALAGRSDQQARPPATDYVAVRYELLDQYQVERPGLYRTTWLAPSADWLEEEPPMSDAVGVELISESVTGLRLRYWDGDKWRDDWATTLDNLRLPEAVAVQFRLLDARRNEHVYESVIPVPTH